MLYILFMFPDGMEDEWDVQKFKEADFDKRAVYFVPDRPCPENTRNRAEASLPRNLTLKPSALCRGVSRLC